MEERHPLRVLYGSKVTMGLELRLDAAHPQGRAIHDQIYSMRAFIWLQNPSTR